MKASIVIKPTNDKTCLLDLVTSIIYRQMSTSSIKLNTNQYYNLKMNTKIQIQYI